MLTTAPNTIVEIVVLSDQPQAFVRVVPVHSRSEFALGEREAPVLDVHMLSPGLLELIFTIFRLARVTQGNRDAVEIGANVSARERQERRGEISV